MERDGRFHLLWPCVELDLPNQLEGRREGARGGLTDGDVVLEDEANVMDASEVWRNSALLVLSGDIDGSGTCILSENTCKSFGAVGAGSTCFDLLLDWVDFGFVISAFLVWIICIWSPWLIFLQLLSLAVDTRYNGGGEFLPYLLFGRINLSMILWSTPLQSRRSNKAGSDRIQYSNFLIPQPLAFTDSDFIILLGAKIK
jgi:hypothetical protein